jgi:ankyrin repeat protein
MSTALHEAVRRGVVEEVQQLLQEGVDTDAVDSEGHTALYLAAESGYRDIFIAFLDGSAQSEPARLAVGPLVAAAAGGQHATVLQLAEAMLRAGMDIHAVNECGMTALEAAEAGGHKLAARGLRDMGAVSAELARLGISLGDGFNPDTNMDLTVAAQQKQAAVVKFLLNSGADVSIRDSTGRTALHAAASSGCLECMGLILAATDDKLVDIADHQAQTPLHLAAAAGHTTAVQYLLHRGASAKTVDREARNALYMAAMNGHADVVQQLIDAGTDITTVTEHRSPLDGAIQGGHTHVARVLFAHGASVDAVSLTAGARTGNFTVLDCLLQHMAQQVKSMPQDSPPPMNTDQTVRALAKSAVAVADSLDAHKCWAVMQKLLKAAVDINRTATAAALQSTLPQQTFRVAAVFAKMWMQASDNLAAADSQPDVNKKMASLQRLVGKLAVAHKEQQEAIQQEASAKSGQYQGAAVMPGMVGKGQQQLLQVRHELTASRRDLQDVLHELHRVQEELSEQQAAKVSLQDNIGSRQAAYDILQERLKTQKGVLSALQKDTYAQHTAYNAMKEKLELETRAWEQLQGSRLLQEAQLKKLQEQVEASKSNLSLQQSQCQQQQAELDAGCALLASDRAKLQTEKDEWEAHQAERLAAQARLQEQEALLTACRARLEEQQAELSRFQERYVAIKHNFSSADHSKQQQLAAEQAQLDLDRAELEVGRMELQDERKKLAKELEAERFKMREAVRAARGERSMQIWRLCAVILAVVLFAICRLYWGVPKGQGKECRQ